MSRTITLVKNANLTNLTGRHAQVAAKIKQAEKWSGSTVVLEKLQKACRTLKPKRFRAIVRQLVAARVVSVKQVASA